KQKFSFVAQLISLMLAPILLSFGQTGRGAQAGTAASKTGLSEMLGSNPSVPTIEITDQEVAKQRGLTSEELRALRKGFGWSNRDIVRIPQSKLVPVVWRLRHPNVDLHAEALRFRRLFLQDENGNIPADGWTKAAAQRKQMRFDAAVWPGRHAYKPHSPKPDGPGQSGSTNSPKPLIAGIESS